MSLEQEVHSYIVYIAYYTGLNLKICYNAQKLRIFSRKIRVWRKFVRPFYDHDHHPDKQLSSSNAAEDEFAVSAAKNAVANIIDISSSIDKAQTICNATYDAV